LEDWEHFHHWTGDIGYRGQLICQYLQIVRCRSNRRGRESNIALVKKRGHAVRRYMLILTAVLILLFTWFMVLRPIARAQDERARYEFLERYRNFQAKAVRRYHPAFREDSNLAAMSIREIRREINLTDAYDQIIKFR
jgi:hypothetical protein